MEIELKLKEIEKYFKDKVFKGDYEFLSCDQYTAKILIDKKYKFQLWIANNPKDNLQFYNLTYDKNMIYDFIFRTQKERLLAYKKLKPLIDEYKNTILKKEKQAQIQNLKRELEKLSKDEK